MWHCVDCLRHTSVSDVSGRLMHIYLRSSGAELPMEEAGCFEI
jgi:hypothetical protein